MTDRFGWEKSNVTVLRGPDHPVAKAIRDAQEVLLKFDPNQERDEAGRWTDGGGGVAAEEPPHFFKPGEIQVGSLDEAQRLNERDSKLAPSDVTGSYPGLKTLVGNIYICDSDAEHPLGANGMSDAYTHHMLQQLDQLPESVKQELRDHSVTIWIGSERKLNEINGNASWTDEQPRGWSPGEKMQEVGGAFSPNGSMGPHITLAGWGRSGDPDGIVLHETGHAIDFIRGYPSSKDPEFVHAYRQELDTWTRGLADPSARQIGDYYRDTSHDGTQANIGAARSEWFATIFRYHVSGESGEGYHPAGPLAPVMSKIVGFDVKSRRDRADTLRNTDLRDLRRAAPQPLGSRGILSDGTIIEHPGFDFGGPIQGTM